MARTINATLDGASGRVADMAKGQITTKTDGGLRTYKLADDSDLTIRIDDSRTKYSFSELYSLWFISKNNFDVELSFDEGKVVRILATRV